MNLVFFFVYFLIPYLQPSPWCHPPGRRPQYRCQCRCGYRCLSAAARRLTGDRCTFHSWRGNLYLSKRSGQIRSQSWGHGPDSYHLGGRVWTMTHRFMSLLYWGVISISSNSTLLWSLIWLILSNTCRINVISCKGLFSCSRSEYFNLQFPNSWVQVSSEKTAFAPEVCLKMCNIRQQK